MIYNIIDMPPVISIGVQSEQGVKTIGFNLQPWLDVFPEMKFKLMPTRPGETEAYPANDQLLVGSVLYWHPDGYDTEISGEGKMEIVGTIEDQRKLSGYVPTIINATSLGVTKEPGEAVAPWYESILKAAQQVTEDLDGVKQMIPDILLVKMGAGNVSSHTQAEVKEAYFARRAVLMVDPRGRVHTMSGLDNGVPVFYNTSAIKALDGNRSPDAILIYTALLGADDKFSVGSPNYNRTPNPYKLSMRKGDTVTTYDGSGVVEIDIPDIPAPTGPGQELVTDKNGNAVWVDQATAPVILSPTDLVPMDGMFSQPQPWEQDMVEGNVYDINYNGTAYECEAHDYHEMQPDAPEGLLILGNLAVTGGTGGNPDAPFVMIAYPNSEGEAEGLYGMLVPGDGATAVTLSITGKGLGVETPEVIYPVNVEVTANTSNTFDFGECDKTWAQIAAAYAAGKTLQIKLHQRQDGGEMVFNARIECEFVSGGALTGLTVRYAVNMYANNDDVRMMTEADGGSVRFVELN